MTATSAPTRTTATTDTLATGVLSTADVLERLTEAVPTMAPQVQRAAQYVLDNPAEIAVATVRGLAEAAGVTPNSMIRMARAVGFDGFDDFRAPFRRLVAEGTPSFPDRARFLQAINDGGQHGRLKADMAAAALANVESLFADIETDDLKGAGDLIAGSRQAHVLGVGTARPLADNFAYVAGMALDHVRAIPTTGIALDDIARLGPTDVLLAMTFAPYRAEIVEAVRLARDRSVPVIAISDSRAAPIAWQAAHAFAVSTVSPLPFSSTVAASALLETLLAFVLADTDVDVVAAIDAFHETRRSAGVYLD